MLPASRRVLASLTAALLLAACSADEVLSPLPTSSSATSASSTGSGGSSGGVGGGGGASTGGGGSGGAPFSPAPHTPFPELTFHGEPSFAHTKLVTITFPGYAHKDEVEAFGDFIVTSKWLLATGEEYGVNDGTHLAKVVLPDEAPAAIDDAGLVALIGDRITDGTLPAGSVADEVLYLIYLPGSTVLTDDGTLCTDFLGYHWEAQAGGQHIAYGVVGDCDGPISDTTSTAAHELIEAATDAVNGWYLDPAEDDPWILLSGLENADLCQELPNVQEGGFALQRSWSDVAAKAGASPCVPIPGDEIYYSVTASPAKVPVIEAGTSATFTLTGWSSAPFDPWELSIDDYPLYDFVPEATLSATSIGNGGKVILKLTVPAGTPSGQIGGVLVDSGPGYGRFWPVAVMVE
jgi:hypothetical protein